ncbi:MAG: hypothetical protein ABIP94_09895 [Planctomycetota bacterium]
MSRSPVLAVACGAMLTACTAVRSDSRRTADWLDGSLTPSSEAARNLLLPVAVPVGFMGLLTDTLLVNPYCAIDDAWGDTCELLWTPREESTLRRVLFTPLAAIATPFVFGGDWWAAAACRWPRAARRPSEVPTRMHRCSVRRAVVGLCLDAPREPARVDRLRREPRARVAHGVRADVARDRAGGVVAILVDTLVAHPLQVVDDALDDSAPGAGSHACAARRAWRVSAGASCSEMR